MDPVDAIERIVYLLDRDLADPFKVRAWQTALDVVRSTPAAELRRRVESDTLTELAGIGATTGGVISECVDGRMPGYLTDLERTTEIPLGVGRSVREALRGDCHSHSLWSDGGADIETMARTAAALGHDYLVLTDHSARLTVAHGLDAERLRRQLDEVAEVNEHVAPFRVLTGMEVDIFEDGTLDLDDDLLGMLDVVVASAHSKLRMESKAMTRRLAVALANPHVDILGHCTNRKLPARAAEGGRGGRGRPQSEFDWELVLAAVHEFDKALEINCRPERLDPPRDLLRLAVEWDVRVSIDTDAHAPGQLEWQAYGCDRAAECGVDPTRVVNTMAADDLLEWAASHDDR